MTDTATPASDLAKFSAFEHGQERGRICYGTSRELYSMIAARFTDVRNAEPKDAKARGRREFQMGWINALDKR